MRHLLPRPPRVRRAAGAALAMLAGLAAAQAPATPAPPALSLTSDEEVPFITTPDRVTLAMLQLAGVGPGDVLVDLGSGDGRIVITAAQRFGARGLGVEIVPDLVAQSRANARRAGVADRADFRVQDLFDTDLSGASVVTLYLLPEVNLRLRPRLLALAPGTRIVSHDWDMADWPPDSMLTLDVPEKAIGREKRSRLFLWTVPAPVQGLWCGSGGLALQLAQRFAEVQGTLTTGTGQVALTGRLAGAQLKLQAQTPTHLPGGPVGASALWALRWQPGAALLPDGAAPAGLPLADGTRLVPALQGRCSAAP